MDLAACRSLDQNQAKAVAETHGVPETFSDFEEMLGAVKPDLVDIITPSPTHKAFVSAAAKRVIPSICQKPFCQSLQEAREVVETLQKYDATCVVHENFRFQPWHMELKSLLDAGKIGEVYQASFRLRPGDGQGPEAYLERQPYFQTMSRFLVHETAIHLVDVFRFLLGEVTTLTAELSQLNPVIAGEDAGIIIFNYEHGSRALFDGNRLADHAAGNRRLTMGDMLIEGSDGTLSLNGDGEIHYRAHGDTHWQEHCYSWDNRSFGGDCVFRLQKHVLSHLHENSPLQNTAQEYVRNLEIEEAIYRSAEEGQRINP